MVTALNTDSMKLLFIDFHFSIIIINVILQIFSGYIYTESLTCKIVRPNCLCFRFKVSVFLCNLKCQKYIHIKNDNIKYIMQYSMLICELFLLP